MKYVMDWDEALVAGRQPCPIEGVIAVQVHGDQAAGAL